MLAAPVLAASVLLIVAGASKVATPAPAALAMRKVRLPSSPAVVRVLGAAEVVLGTAAAVLASPILLASIALVYVAFAVFCLVLLRLGDAAGSCGCFGEARTPVGLTHVILNLVIAATTGVAAFVGEPGLGSMAVSLIVAGGVLAGALLVSFTLLPQVLADSRDVISTSSDAD